MSRRSGWIWIDDNGAPRRRTDRGLVARAAFLAAALIALLVPATALAAFPADATVEYSAATGKVRFVGMPAANPAARPQGFGPTASHAAVGRAFLDEHADELGLDGPSALAVRSSTPGLKGTVSVRYQQTLKGIEVLGGQFAVRLDSERNIRSLNGEVVPGGEDFDSTPSIDAAAAQRAAIAHVAKRERVKSAGLSAAKASLKVFDSRILGGPGLKRPTLVYATLVSSSRDAELRRLVFIDAERGTEVATIDETHEIKNRSVCDGANNPAGAQLPCTSPVVTEGGSVPASPLDVAPAYNFSGATYDFFFTRFGRDSLDDAGLPLKSTVRYCDPSAPCPYANAFWNGQQMAYGDTYAQRRRRRRPRARARPHRVHLESLLLLPVGCDQRVALRRVRRAHRPRDGEPRRHGRRPLEARRIAADRRDPQHAGSHPVQRPRPDGQPELHRRRG